MTDAPNDMARENPVQIDSFKQPYADAGHDVESVFATPSYKCKVCGAYQIDLSEDLAYGDMRTCKSTTPYGRAGSEPDAIEGQMRKMASKIRALSNQDSEL